MMIIIFWEMTPCGSYKNRRFGGSYRLHLLHLLVPLHEASFLPLPLQLLYGCIPHTVHPKYRYTKPIPHSSNLGLFSLSTAWLSIPESLPVQELTTSLCNLLALVHPEDGGIQSSETSVLIRATRCHLPEDDNHQTYYCFYGNCF
jgi:hypothetical protein